MERGQPLGDGFQLLIGLAEIHVPRMWVERHVSKPDSQVSATRSEYKVRLCENQNFLLLFSCNFTKFRPLQPTLTGKGSLFPYFPEQEAEFVEFESPSNLLIIDCSSSLFVYYG